MKLKVVGSGVIALLLATSPASANVWLDDFGDSTTFHYPGATPLLLQPGAHTLADAGILFRKACLAGSFERADVAAVLDASGWGFRFVDRMMPFKEPVNIGGFQADDAAVNVSEKSFFHKKPQCNVLVRAIQPYERDAAIAALTSALGGGPSNAADSVKKGKPNKRYQPRWELQSPSGESQTVSVRASVNDPAVIHFAVLQKVSK